MQAHVLIVVASLLVAGCTGAQLEADRQTRIRDEVVAGLEVCSQKISTNTNYSPLKTKMMLEGGGQTPLAMLTDNTKPTKQEINLLYALYGDFQSCRQIALDGASRAHPLRVIVFVEMYTASDKLWADAVSGKLTWAEFNRGRDDIILNGRTKMALADEEINRGLQNQHTTEIAQRQRAAEAFQQWTYQQQQIMSQQQMINAVNRPRTINCNYYGNTAQCSSF